MRSGRYACPTFFNHFTVIFDFFWRELAFVQRKPMENLKGVLL